MAQKPFPEIQYLRERARAQCSGLASRLDELVYDFPGGTPSEFIAVLQVVIAELKQLTDRTSERGILSWICVLVEQYLSEYLTWLDNAHSAQTPRALVRLLEKTATSLNLAPDARLLVAPTYECNYSIDDQVTELRSLLISFLSAESMKKIFDRLPASLFLVQFPRIERDHVLNSAIFGHELGHPIVVGVLATYERTPEYKKHVKDVQSKLKQLQITQNTLPAYRRQQQEQDFKKVYEIYSRGLTELLCDAAGAYIFGPSALFAAVDHLFATSLDNPPVPDKYYPPTRYRHREMWKVLQKEGHVDALDRLCKQSGVPQIRRGAVASLQYMRKLASAKGDVQALRADKLCAIAYDWIERTLPTARANTRTACKPFLYSTQTLQLDVPQLLERLAVGMPPSERGLWPDVKSVDWRSSLIAGWLTKFGSVGVARAQTDEAAEFSRHVNRLTMKGIEDAILAADYASHLVQPS